MIRRTIPRPAPSLIVVKVVRRGTLPSPSIIVVNVVRRGKLSIVVNKHARLYNTFRHHRGYHYGLLMLDQLTRRACTIYHV